MRDRRLVTHVIVKAIKARSTHLANLAFVGKEKLQNNFLLCVDVFQLICCGRKIEKPSL